MSDFGLSEVGFTRKRLDDIVISQEQNYQVAYGDNFTLDDSTPFGVLAGLQSGDFANLWEIAELSFSSFSPSQATGFYLDTIAEYNGLRRNEATRSTVILELGGDDNTPIEIGSKVEVTDTGEVFITTQDAVIQSGSVLVTAQSENTGPIAAGINTITTIITSIPGWDTVTNPDAAQEGTELETDEEFRIRREKSVGVAASNTTDAIFSAVSDVDGTTDVVVLENETDVVDGNGLTPHAFEVIVKGGNDGQIGSAIRGKKPTGIQSLGSTVVQIPDKQGFAQPIRFTRPADIEIEVNVEITALADFPGNGEDLIKQAIVDYANGQLEGFEDRGFSTGDDVILSELYTPINTVPGHSVNSLEIAKSGQPLGTSNIAIRIREVSLFLVANITVSQ